MAAAYSDHVDYARWRRSLRGFNTHFIASGYLPGLYLGHKYFLVGASRRVVFSSGDLSRAQGTLKSAAESLFCVLFPSDCRICHLPLTNISALPVCSHCLARITPLEGVLCNICGEKLFTPERFAAVAEPLCGLCRRVVPPFRKAFSYGAYAGPLRDLVHLLKYHQVKPAAHLLGKLVSGVIATAGLPSEFLVLPVPLWTGKRRTRGFNQAEQIARALVSGTASTRIQLDTTSLVRQRETASQTGLTRHQRRANVRGAFAVVRPDAVRGQTILLVDDVMTTGTTAGECARVLLRAGAKEVFVATVARATKEVQGGQVFAAVAQ